MLGIHETIKFSPGEPAGGAPEAPTAPAAEAPVVSEQAKLESDFTEKAKAGVDTWLKRVKGPEPKDAEKAPNDEVPLSPDITEKKAEPMKAPETKPVDEKKSEEAKAPEVKPPENKPLADNLRLRVRGAENEYTRAEIEQVVDFALRANEKLVELQAWEQKIAQHASKPEMKLVELLSNNPEIKARFMKVLEDEDPAMVTHHSIETQATELQALKNEIAMLKQTQAQKETQAQQRMQERQQQLLQKEREVQTKSYVDQINAAIAPEVSQVGVSPETVDDIGWRYYRECRANNVVPTIDSTVAYYRQSFQKILAERESYRANATNGYLQQKGRAPLAPPTGGAAPRIQPAAPKTMKEAKSAALQYMQAMLEK